MKKKNLAFSLVEMLMALLVASLLMVALAPVITKKFSENLSISSIGGTRADYKRTWYYDPTKEYHEWSVPNGVNVIKVTAIGGGGAGGGSSFGSREFTTDTTWNIPEGVEKIRVFMTGGGGAGAAGGAGTATYFADIGTQSGNSGDITTSGEWKLSTTTAYRNIPTLPKLCTDSGVTKWTLVSNTAKNDIEPLTSYVNIKACGGGGGGGGSGGKGGGGGGSGGKLDQDFYLTSTLQKLNIRIGGYGGGGGGDNTTANAGGSWGGGAGGGGNHTESTIATSPSQDMGRGYGSGGYARSDNAPTRGRGGAGDTADGSGGGGDGTDRDSQSSGDLPGGSGQGGAGKGGAGISTSITGGSGGGGSSVAGGGGGGSGGGAGGGGGGPTWIRELGYYVVAAGGGGGGGGSNSDIQSGGGAGGGGGYGGGNGADGATATGPGPGGKAGSGGNDGYTATACSTQTITDCYGGNGGSSPFTEGTGKNYCAGGTGGAGYSTGTSGYKNGANGQQGWMKISWTYVKNGLQCTYTQSANGSGGGGAGQIWFGEMNVKNMTTLEIKIGAGGVPSSSFGGNGGDGGSTTVGSVTVLGGEGGKYKSNDADINDSAGEGRGYRTTSLKNWNTDKITDDKFESLKLKMGQGGLPGHLVSDTTAKAAGGNGGNTINKDGGDVYGGNAGNAGTSGEDAKGYGAGGAGGGGVNVDGGEPGMGGKGGGGYVYIEWGNTNGGGGASGQVITQESVWVTPGTIVKIYPGAGGIAKELKEINTTVGATTITEGYKGQDGPDGGDTYLIVKDASAEKKVGIAKGGKGGFGGGATHGRGGGIKVDGSGNYDPDNIQPEIENSTPGATATATEGGMGGTLTEEMCPLLTELKKVGLGGCGGNASSSGACLSAASVSGAGVNAGGLGNGGGGGAVVEVAGVKTPNKGGNGSSGMVTIEWSN